MIVIEIVLLLGLMQFIQRDIGASAGTRAVDNAQVVSRIITTMPLDIPNMSIITDNNGTQYYSYTGLRLLTFNNGKYYIFSDIDTKICKPYKVYVIDENIVIKVEIGTEIFSGGICN
jgi:hypothetical protein